MDIFNNRELALIFWCMVITLFTVLNRDLRKSFFSVLVAFFQKAIIIPIIIYITYVAMSCWALNGLGLWDANQIKSTIVWFMFSGMSVLFHVVTTIKNKEFFKDWIIGQFKAIVLVEFLVSLDSFSLMTEVFLLPFISVVSIMATLAEREEKYRAVSRLCNAILVSVGLFLVFHAIHTVLNNLDGFAKMRTIEDLSNPIVLSFSALPFLYILYLYASYENVFSTLRFSIEDKKLERYAKISAALSFGYDVEFLKRWCRKIQMSSPSNNADIKQSIFQIKKIKQRERFPPDVGACLGWSPSIAKKFLESHGLY